MPKDSRQRSRVHAAPTSLVKRQFAAQDNAVQHVEPGSASADLSATELLEAESHPFAHSSLTKKEKHDLKHQNLMDRLNQSITPYSKSHARRVKRRAKEQLAGGLDDIQAEISKIASDGLHDSDQPNASSSTSQSAFTGKNHPLSQRQRKKALQVERIRHPMVMANPAFATNPWETIATHARNTLTKT